MNAVSNNIRHAVSGQTGATTLAFRTGRGDWTVQCLSHKAETKVKNRMEAWKTSSHPAEFCTKCKAIASGKAKKIEKGNKVEIPSGKAKTTKATTTKTTTRKAPAKPKAAPAKETKATTAKPRTTRSSRKAA